MFYKAHRTGNRDLALKLGLVSNIFQETSAQLDSEDSSRELCIDSPLTLWPPNMTYSPTCTL